ARMAPARRSSNRTRSRWPMSPSRSRGCGSRPSGRSGQLKRGCTMRRALTVALAVLAVAGCGSKKAPGHTGATSSGASANSGAAAPKDATLTYLDSNELMVGWDPSTSYSNEVSVMNNMYEQLVRYDKTSQKIVPQLATSWAKSDGGKTWTFHLRPNVKFHTGR